MGQILHLGVRGVPAAVVPMILKKPQTWRSNLFLPRCRQQAVTGFSRSSRLAKQFVVCLISMRWMPFMRRLRVPPCSAVSIHDEAVDIIQTIGSSSDLKGCHIQVARLLTISEARARYLAARLISDLLGFAMKRKRSLSLTKEPAMDQAVFLPFRQMDPAVRFAHHKSSCPVSLPYTHGT